MKKRRKTEKTPHSYKGHLAALKDILMTATDFRDVFAYFMDHFGNNADFLALGREGKSMLLDGIVEQIARQVIESNVQVRNMFLREIPELKFIHGMGTANDWIFNMFLFVESKTGLVAMAPPFWESGGLSYVCRFSTLPETEGNPLFLPNPGTDVVN